MNNFEFVTASLKLLYLVHPLCEKLNKQFVLILISKMTLKIDLKVSSNSIN